MEGKRGNYIALAVTLSALGALLLCSQAALESARAGLSLCAQMIVPSLLPFFMLSSLLQLLRYVLIFLNRSGNRRGGRR